MPKLLVVDDDEDLADNVKDWLQRENYSVEIAYDGETALHLLQVYQYDLIILDWALPGPQGIDILRWLRQRKNSAPVIMLTGQSHMEQKEAGLDSGADDYLTKPFDPRELSARIRTILRRVDARTENVLRVGDLILEPTTKRVTVRAREVLLLPREFALLEFLARHPKETFDGNALLQAVWTSDSDASVNTIKSFVYTLRKKLEAAGLPQVIETVRGAGYRIVT